MSPPVTLVRDIDLRANTNDLAAKDDSRTQDQLNRGNYWDAICLATDVVGDFVHISGPKTTLFNVTRVDRTNQFHFPVIGIITSKSSATECSVQRNGIIDVSGFPSGIVLTAGDNYYVGSDGQLTNVITTIPGVDNVVQLVGQALSATELLLVEGHLPVILCE